MTWSAEPIIRLGLPDMAESEQSRNGRRQQKDTLSVANISASPRRTSPAGARSRNASPSMARPRAASNASQESTWNPDDLPPRYSTVIKEPQVPPYRSASNPPRLDIIPPSEPLFSSTTFFSPSEEALVPGLASGIAVPDNSGSGRFQIQFQPPSPPAQITPAPLPSSSPPPPSSLGEPPIYTPRRSTSSPPPLLLPPLGLLSLYTFPEDFGSGLDLKPQAYACAGARSSDTSSSPLTSSPVSPIGAFPSSSLSSLSPSPSSSSSSPSTSSPSPSSSSSPPPPPALPFPPISRRPLPPPCKSPHASATILPSPPPPPVPLKSPSIRNSSSSFTSTSQSLRRVSESAGPSNPRSRSKAQSSKTDSGRFDTFRPCVIPQTIKASLKDHRRPHLHSPFSRAYPPELRHYGISRRQFLRFIDDLNEAYLVPSFWENANKLENILNQTPSVETQAVAFGLHATADYRAQRASRKATAEFLKRANARTFDKRGLCARVLKTTELMDHLGDGVVIVPKKDNNNKNRARNISTGTLPKERSRKENDIGRCSNDNYESDRYDDNGDNYNDTDDDGDNGDDDDTEDDRRIQIFKALQEYTMSLQFEKDQDTPDSSRIQDQNQNLKEKEKDTKKRDEEEGSRNRKRDKNKNKSSDATSVAKREEGIANKAMWIVITKKDSGSDGDRDSVEVVVAGGGDDNRSRHNSSSRPWDQIVIAKQGLNAYWQVQADKEKATRQPSYSPPHPPPHHRRQNSNQQHQYRRELPSSPFLSAPFQATLRRPSVSDRDAGFAGPSRAKMQFLPYGHGF